MSCQWENATSTNFTLLFLDVTSTLTELILISISQKSNLLDSFVILYAVVVGSLYRLIGVDFGKYVQLLLFMHVCSPF
jgi:hypothetical protein